MHGYDVHDTLDINCEILGPRVKGSSSRIGPKWPHSENVLTLLQFNSSGRYYGCLEIVEAFSRTSLK